MIRNPGGRITTGLQSLLFVDTLTGGQALKDIVIVHHLGKYKHPSVNVYLF